LALILVIDDDAFYRSVIRRILEENGHEVIEAEGGAEGIEAWREWRPHMVITDMSMPGMDGRKVIETIRTADDQSLIIAVSGEGQFYNIDFLNAARDLHVDGILRKLDSKFCVLHEIESILRKLS
jgi:CheY-like chemotaxis protein